ncbi:PEP-CTERM sorting domain-containing protein [Massilia sp. MB5]|uniref:PEP-CTERM sorting domain-containing protein n=1 Tax=Massilia sp. MB5 TaxID=2919578 RepID=UPI001F0EE1F1|nr:PEP-CTERM sorting domain-containing protein [Massilia sp. MB5]UMR31028.1 PEP-CTERM sorting domain-containing protein [Massilia sp. MB5]
MATAAAFVLAGAAQAGTIGAASLDDVTLGGNATAYWADALNYYGSNPGSDASSFAAAFAGYGNGGAWSLMGTAQGNSFSVANSAFNYSFSKNAGNQSGTWSITNLSAAQVVLDLAFSMHTGDAGTAFLFDNQAIGAGQTLQGSWKIEWLNNADKIPNFSNMNLFGRDLSGGAGAGAAAAITAVPEPATWAMLLTGLCGIGLTLQRGQPARVKKKHGNNNSQ